MHTSGKLYIVPTPIGNLADLSFRAVEVLKLVKIILAEDTRTSAHLLNHYSISTPTRSYHSHNEHHVTQSILENLKNGDDIAQISDAGTPGISDPGYYIIHEALAKGIKVEVLPGPSAFLPALIKSGFPTDRFVYEGFLPLKKGRKKRMESWKDETRTVVFYESPHRLLKALEYLYKVLGKDRNVSISRELTKKFEETVTGTMGETLDYFKSKPIKGEFVVVVEGIRKKTCE